MKGSKVVSTGKGNFVPDGKGDSTSGVAKESGEAGSWGQFLPSGEKGPGIKGVSGGGMSGGGGWGNWLPDGDRSWAKGV